MLLQVLTFVDYRRDGIDISKVIVTDLFPGRRKTEDEFTGNLIPGPERERRNQSQPNFNMFRCEKKKK